jgi:hypothetical protein
MNSQDAALADSLLMDGNGGPGAGGGGALGSPGRQEGLGGDEGGRKVFAKPGGEMGGAKPVEVQGAGGEGLTGDIAGVPAGVQEVE